MAAQGDFSRFFFEVWLDDDGEQDEYMLSPQLYVRFERGCQGYVAYIYDGSELFAEEYETGLCRPSAMSNYSSVIERGELSLDETREMLAKLQATHRRIPEEDVPLCEEGLYYCGTGSLPAYHTAPRDPGRIPKDLPNDVGEAASPVPSGGPALVEPDVAANLRLACWLAGVTEAELVEHMAGIGLPRFGESLEAGLGASPYAAVREAARHVGCPLEVLLGTDDDLFRWVVGVVGESGKWDLCPGTPDLADRRSAPGLTLFALGVGGRALLIAADFADRGLTRCTGLRLETVIAVVDGATVGDSMRRELADPRPDASRAFLDAYVGAGGDLGGAHSPTDGAHERGADIIRVNEFLVRRSYGSHMAGGHRLDPVRASVSVLPRDGGGAVPVEFDAWWCPKCGRHFMSEGAYVMLKRMGYICCKVVEERDLGTREEGDGPYGTLAPESVLHMYGYTVNQRDDLTEGERRAIISFVIENRVQTAQEVARLLEWLISQRDGVPGMSVAVGRWRADLDFVRHYHAPTRRVRVDSIYARV